MHTTAASHCQASVSLRTPTLRSNKNRSFKKGGLGCTCLVLPGTLLLAFGTDKEHPKERLFRNAFLECSKGSEKERDERSLHGVPGPCSQVRPSYLQSPQGIPQGTSTGNALSGTPSPNARKRLMQHTSRIQRPGLQTPCN